jgi:NADPH-dependent 2,4-dienoyl-CoA reductase/sulfur reductase-like enzyme
MSRESPQHFDVLVIGAGPAGISAAVRAAECGQRVGIVDDNSAAGGQIWRGETDSVEGNYALRWIKSLRATGVMQLFGTRVFDQPEAGVLLAEGTNDVLELRYTSLILATGARERFLPFPGWTLPNVMGAGGLQAMVKSGLPICGKRVVVAGTGPLLLGVAAFLRKKGAEILIVCEQASWLSLIRFAANSWPSAAHGQQTLRSVTINNVESAETYECDYLACGFHLIPNLELQQLLGCQTDSERVKVDDFQQTTVKGVFSAGETTGIGGVDAAIVEGQIAGFAAAGNLPEARKLFNNRNRARRFARAMDRAFRLRPELKEMASEDTVVCRCEDVRHSRLRQQISWRAAKLQTRCGMGPCQGRVCGPACEFLFGWSPDSVRPPIFPARIESLAAFSGAGGEKNAAVRGDSQ